MKLVLLLVVLVAGLYGCHPIPQKNQSTSVAASEVVLPGADIAPWIAELKVINAYNQEQAESAFKTFRKPLLEPFELYRYGLVNQRLGDRIGWIRARDSFRQLSRIPLDPGLLPLINQLQLHNQQMINADARKTRLIEAVTQGDEEQRQLAAELENSQQALEKLQQQMEALKAVEAAISNKRKTPEATDQ